MATSYNVPPEMVNDIIDTVKVDDNGTVIEGEKENEEEPKNKDGPENEGGEEDENEIEDEDDYSDVDDDESRLFDASEDDNSREPYSSCEDESGTEYEKEPEPNPIFNVEDLEGWDIDMNNKVERMVTKQEWSPLLYQYQKDARYELLTCLQLCRNNRAAVKREEDDPVLAEVVHNLPELIQNDIVSWLTFPQPSTIVSGIYAEKYSGSFIIPPDMSFVESVWWDDYWLGGRLIDHIPGDEKFWLERSKEMMAKGCQGQRFRREGNFMEWFGKCQPFRFEAHFIARAVRTQFGLYHGLSEWALDVTRCAMNVDMTELGASPETRRYYLVKRF